MKKIFIRSPYFIEVDELGQFNAKIEVFLWNKGSAVPTNPKYTFSKNVASSTNNLISWNISYLAKEFIKPVVPVNVTEPTEESSNTWCYMRIKRYSDDNLLDTETYVCLNGYTNYMNGYNQSTEDLVVPLLNTDIKFQKSSLIVPYVNVFYEAGSYDTTLDYIIVEERTMYKIPLITDEYSDDYIIVNSEQLCEPIYTPITCTYINRFGGWQFLTFFKANSSSIDVTSKDYNLLPSSLDYNPLQGQRKRFNFQGKQKIKCNTGWVDENYFELIQDLLLSEVVLLDNKPAIVKSQSADVKTHLKDKNINYEIEFEYNFGLINDVI